MFARTMRLCDARAAPWQASLFADDEEFDDMDENELSDDDEGG